MTIPGLTLPAYDGVRRGILAPPRGFSGRVWAPTAEPAPAAHTARTGGTAPALSSASGAARALLAVPNEALGTNLLASDHRAAAQDSSNSSAGVSPAGLRPGKRKRAERELGLLRLVEAVAQTVGAPGLAGAVGEVSVVTGGGIAGGRVQAPAAASWWR
jgi:hypothetical protein